MAWLQVNFKSEKLIRNTTLNIVLPLEPGPGMPPKPFKPFRTLYLLHGLTGDSTDWLLNSQVYELAQQYDIAVVMMSGDNSFYTDHASSAERYSEFIGQELIEFTRKLLPLSDKREDTVIAGLSMGGYGSLYNGLRHNDVFGHIIALSSALIAPAAEHATETPDGMGLNRAYYETIFGDVTKVEENGFTLRTLAKNAMAQCESLIDLYFACGWNDMLVFDNRAFHKYLTEIDFLHTYEEGPGTHEWEFWNTFLRKGLSRIWPLPEFDPALFPFWIEKPEEI
jgi:S-formylglutathione hydrolase FrmB